MSSFFWPGDDENEADAADRRGVPGGVRHLHLLPLHLDGVRGVPDALLARMREVAVQNKRASITQEVAGPTVPARCRSEARLPPSPEQHRSAVESSSPRTRAVNPGQP